MENNIVTTLLGFRVVVFRVICNTFCLQVNGFYLRKGRGCSGGCCRSPRGAEGNSGRVM